MTSSMRRRKISKSVEKGVIQTCTTQIEDDGRPPS